MNAKVIALPKRDFNFNWSYYQTTIGKKRFEFFRALAWEKTQIRHDLPPLLSRMTPFQSVFWSSLYFLLGCSSLDFRVFTYVFSCSLSRSSHRTLPILVSSLTLWRVFLDSLYAFYSLLFSVALSLSIRPIFTQTLSPRTWVTISCRWQSFSSAGIVALLFDQKLQNTENYCSTSTTSVWFPAQNAGCKLFVYAAPHLLAQVKPSCNS